MFIDMNTATIENVNPLKGMRLQHVKFAFAFERTENALKAAIIAGYSDKKGSAGTQGSRLAKKPQIRAAVQFAKDFNDKHKQELLIKDYGLSPDTVDNIQHILDGDVENDEQVNMLFDDVVHNVNYDPSTDVYDLGNWKDAGKDTPGMGAETKVDGKWLPATRAQVENVIKDNIAHVKRKLMTTLEAAVFNEEVAMVSGLNYIVHMGNNVYRKKEPFELNPAERFCVGDPPLDENGKVLGYKLKDLNRIYDGWTKQKGLLREKSEKTDEREVFVGISINGIPLEDGKTFNETLDKPVTETSEPEETPEATPSPVDVLPTGNSVGNKGTTDWNPNYTASGKLKSQAPTPKPFTVKTKDYNY